MAITRNKPGIRSARGGRVSIGFQGAKKLDRTLGKLELGLRGKPARTAVKKGGAVTAKRMRQLAPVDTSGGGVKTPRITKKSISTKVREYKRVTVSVTGPRLFDSPNPYWIEYGTAPHLISPAGQKGAVGRLRVGQKWVAGATQHPGAEAQPFIRPAIEQTSDQAAGVIRKVFQDEVRRLAKSG